MFAELVLLVFWPTGSRTGCDGRSRLGALRENVSRAEADESIARPRDVARATSTSMGVAVE